MTDGDYDEAGIILFKWGCIIIMASTILPKKGFEGFFTLTTTTRMTGYT